MKKLYILSLVFIAACGVQQENDPSKKQNFTRTEVGEILNEILTEGGKNLPYQTAANKSWKLEHTDLKITVNFEKHIISGTATLTLSPYFYIQDSLVLDAKKMDIFDVRFAQQNGAQNGPAPEKISWKYVDSMHLVLKFKEKFTSNQKVKISIDYQANPERQVYGLGETQGTAITSNNGAYFINTEGKDPVSPIQMWTQGEPQANSCWFPTIDVPNQKHTHRIEVTYPAKLNCISNGQRTSSETEKFPENAGAPVNPTKTDVWEMTQPHSVYLTMLAIGDWKSIPDRTAKLEKEIPVQYFVEDIYAADAKSVFGNTPEMIEFFSSFTGVPYMWPKYDQIATREFVSGAMENTTAVIHNERIQDPDNDMEDYISHELFHHWFGDYVTCESWAHLTMNESFANYSEYLWREHKYGKANADAWMVENLEIDAESSNKNSLVNHHYINIDDQFDDIRYNKGAGILHRLRNFIGDEAFKASIKLYLTSNAYKNANAYDWKKCVETVTGTNMDFFFNTWYFTKGETEVYAQLENEGEESVLRIINNTQNGDPTVRHFGSAKALKLRVIAQTEGGRYIDTSFVTFPYNELNEFHFPNERITSFVVDPQYANALIPKGTSFMRTDMDRIEPEEIEFNYQNLKFAQKNNASHVIINQLYVEWLKSYVQFGISQSKHPDRTKVISTTKVRFLEETLNGLNDSNLAKIWLPLANDFTFKPEEELESGLKFADLFPTDESTQNTFMNWIKDYYKNSNITYKSKLQFYNSVPREMESKFDAIYPFYTNPTEGINAIKVAAKNGNTHEVVLLARIYYDINKEKNLSNVDQLYQFTLSEVSNTELSQKIRRDIVLIQYSRLTDVSKKYDLMIAALKSDLNKEYLFKIIDRSIPFADETNVMENTQFLSKIWNSELVKNSIQYQRMIKKATLKEWEMLKSTYPQENDVIKSSTKERYRLIKVIQNVD